MIKNKLLKISAAFVFSLMVVSCSNSIDDMLDKYNDNFTVVYNDPVNPILTPDDQGFDEKNLLLDSYVVSNVSTFNLAAPENCASYKWEIQNPECGDLEPVHVLTTDGTTSTTRRFVCYIPDSRDRNVNADYEHNGLTGGKTYRLSLKVYAKDGKVYTDYATFAIYNDYYWETGIVTIPPQSGVASRSAEVAYSPKTAVNARTVLPDVPDIDDTRWHYYLYAQNLLTNKSIRPFKVEINKNAGDSSNKSGDFEFNIPSGNYLLTLMALDEEPLQDDYDYLFARCSYIGFAAADNRYCDNAYFVLKPAVDTLVGWTQLSVYTKNWNFQDSMYDGFTVSTEMRDSTGALVSQNPSTELTKTNIGSGSPTGYYNYAITLSPGVYTWSVIFTKGLQRYTWSDKVVVVNNIITKAELGIPLLIPTGLSNFKIYTDGWKYTDSEYSGFITDLSVTEASTNKTVAFEETNHFLTANMTDSEPGSANFGLAADLGSYKLNISFTRNGKTYTYSQPFVVEAGKTKTETVGITPVIPMGTYNFKLFTDGWNLTDSAYTGYTTELKVLNAVNSSADYKHLTDFTVANLTGTVPSSANFAMYAELGSYILNISFTKDSKTYTWSYPFEITGNTTTETVGISSSVIPLDSAGG